MPAEIVRQAINVLVDVATQLPPKPRQNKPLLLHGPRRVEVQKVTVRHKKPCSGCSDLPTGTRLLVTEGGGRASSSSVYCAACGERYLATAMCEYARAVTALRTPFPIRVCYVHCNS